jgi:esterase/lipase superfamily enzyme
MRQYRRDWSPALGRDMEALRFGVAGLPMLVFPTSVGRFYQWEDFGLVAALEDKIMGGYIQLWCVDSIDDESWYATNLAPGDRVARHFQYERYLIDELIPKMPRHPVTVGTSFGATHALLIALRFPQRISGFIGLSGAYDTARWLDGQGGDDAFFANPMAFLPGLTDESYLQPLRSMEKKIIATGEGDANVEESVQVAGLMNDKAIGVTLDIWPGWAHDWPYWGEMMRRYV